MIVSTRLLKVGSASIWRWKKRREQGQLAAHYPKIRGNYKIDEAKLRAYVKQNPDAYQSEIAEFLGVSCAGVQAALKRLEITRKKRPRNIVSAMKSGVVHI